MSMPSHPFKHRRSAVFDPPSGWLGSESTPKALFVRDFQTGLASLEDHLEMTLAQGADACRIAYSLGQQINRHETLKRVVASVVENCAARVMSNGEVWFEIVRPPADPSYLLPMPPYKMTVIFRSVLQHIPKDSRARVGRAAVRLATSDTMSVAMPAALGGPRGHRNLLRRLGRIEMVPPFHATDVPGFEFATYRAIANEHLARLSSRWGGIPSFDGGGTELLNIYRSLQFARARSIVVSQVISDINKFLVTQNASATIQMSPAVSPDRFNDALQELLAGRLSLSDGVKIAFS